MKKYYSHPMTQKWFEKIVELRIKQKDNKYFGYDKDEAAKLIYERDEAFRQI